jgi:hypothetical protein
MNKYKEAIKVVRELLADQIENEDDGPQRGMYQVVDNELKELHDWITEEDCSECGAPAGEPCPVTCRSAS